MCAKLSSGDLNPDPYPTHLINTYTYGMTITPKECRSQIQFFKILEF